MVNLCLFNEMVENPVFRYSLRFKKGAVNGGLLERLHWVLHVSSL